MAKDKPFFSVAIERPDILDWEDAEERKVVDFIEANEIETYDSLSEAVDAGAGLIVWIIDAARRGAFHPKFPYDDFIVQKIDADGDIVAEYDSEGNPMWE